MAFSLQPFALFLLFCPCLPILPLCPLSIVFPPLFSPPSTFQLALLSLIRSLSTEPHVSESIRAESRRGRSFTEVNIKLHQAPGRKRGRGRGGERGSPPSLIHRIDQAGMRVIYYFDKIRFSDAHRYPRQSISFFSLFSSLFSPSASGTGRVHCSPRVSACACARCMLLSGMPVCACALECGWVTIGTALGNVGKRWGWCLQVALHFYKQAAV